LSPLIIKTAIAGAARVVAGVIAFTVTAAVARALGSEASGLFFLGVSLLAALTMFFRLGLDGVVLRIIATEPLSLKAQVGLNTALLWVTLASVPSALLIFVLSDFISVFFFSKPEFASLLRWFILGLPAFALFTTLSSAFQGQHRMIATVMFQRLGISACFLTLFMSCLFAFPNEINAVSTAAMYAISSVVVLIVGLFIWYKQPGIVAIPLQFKKLEMWSSSSNMWVTSIMGIVVNCSGVLVAGAYVQTFELAYLVAAQRTAGLIAFVLMVINTVAMPRYANLWSKSDPAAIRRLAKISSRTALFIAVPVVVFIVFFADDIMGLFGKDFEHGAHLLLILAIGQLVDVASGSAVGLLMMTGFERNLRRVALFTGPLSIVCAVWFTSVWGVTGAAIAMALGLSLHNLAALAVVRHRLGFWPLG
jgi:O-antigen/teichoic acid export membrane protein